jgi:predicted nucleic acid-binding protein
VPDRFKSRTGLAFVVDTNFVDDPSPAAAELRTLHEGGWINLSRSDTLVTELLRARDDAQREELIAAASEYVEHRGPAVWGHSRWGTSVWATEEDADLIATVFDILHPDLSMPDTRRNHVRDAMHVATAIRYGLNGFVTRDDGILGKQARIKDRFDGFLVCDPPHALVISRRFAERARASQPTDEEDA